MDAAEHDRMYEVEREHFWFVGTRDVVMEVLSRALGDGRASARILDAGCGTAYTLNRVRQAGFTGPLTGVDLSEHALSLAAQREPSADFVRANLRALPFDDGSFDAILCLDALEHMDEDRATAAELVRVLRPGGVLLVTVPSRFVPWSAHDDALEHKRRYLRRELVDVLRGAGAEVRIASYYNTLLYPIVAAARVAGWARDRLASPRGNGTTKPRSDTKVPAPWLNRALYRTLSFERHVVGRASLPIGVSILAVAEKPAA